MLSLVACFKTLVKLSLHNAFCASLRVHSEILGKINFLSFFQKKAYSAFFSLLKRSYL